MNILSGLFHLSRPFLHALDAEQAHLATIRALSCLPLRQQGKNPYPQLSQNLFGLNFSNPVGLAPGFDKNAEVPHTMLGFGFGFVEVGTVTPRPQLGNAKPRLFRLSEDRAVINRMGFNNQGHEAVLHRLSQRRAESVVRWLIDKGVDRDRLVPRGYGEGMTTNKCINNVKCSEEEHQLNRRTEFRVLGCKDCIDKDNVKLSKPKANPRVDKCHGCPF